MLVIFTISLLTWGVVEGIKLYSKRKEKLELLRSYIEEMKSNVPK